MNAARSIGIAGATDADTVRRLAPLIEAAGYRALWVNDTPRGDALAALAAAAEVTTTLGLATGVIPLDRQPGSAIAARVRDLGLPVDRLRLGVGSGAARRGLALLQGGVAELQDGCDAPVLIGALGPRTRELAARIADGILLSWLTPAAAAAAMTTMRADADGRAVEGVLYARTIADPAARPALETESAQYGTFPQYAAHFARLGIDPIDATIDLTVAGSIEAYATLDELVLRVVTASGSLDEIEAVIEAGAPGR